jgi:D-alanyl-D-alanine carboxypeptidase/D-alanyl-D-alanine-endopeptidase (penicillin-binding protein 4)
MMLADKGQAMRLSLLQSITTILSPELSKIVYWLNQKSINLYAEQLLATLGSKAGKDASTNDGVDAVKAFWELKGYR